MGKLARRKPESQPFFSVRKDSVTAFNTRSGLREAHLGFWNVDIHKAVRGSESWYVSFAGVDTPVSLFVVCEFFSKICYLLFFCLNSNDLHASCTLSGNSRFSVSFYARHKIAHAAHQHVCTNKRICACSRRSGFFFGVLVACLLFFFASLIVACASLWCLSLRF